MHACTTSVSENVFYSRFLNHVRIWKVFHLKNWVFSEIVTTTLNSAKLWNFATT
jgi:hypothetical protein